MGIASNLLVVALIVLVSAVLLQEYLIINSKRSLNAIEIQAEENKWTFDNVNVEKFNIIYDQNEWDLLIKKLNSTRYFSLLKDKSIKKFEFGFNVEFAKELIHYWMNGFNWEKQVDNLNRYSHYRIKYNDITLHYIRVNDYQKIEPQSKRIPLLLLSGWPGSFYEFYQSIEIINKKFNNRNRYFDIIVPSIPGYDFSTPLDKTFDVVETSRIYDALMRYLFGSDCTYFVHGEDWGSVIATSMAQMYPIRVSGIHITMDGFLYPIDLKFLSNMILTELFPSYMLTEDELSSNISFSLINRVKVLFRETGYMHIQATKPDTIGLALTDSPAGLLAYILEKYSTWSFNYDNEIVGQHDGSLNKFSKDDLLTIVTLYWMTNSITSSIRYYKCFFIKSSNNWFNYDLSRYKTPKGLPVAITFAPNELDHTPYNVLKHAYTGLVQYKLLKTGGHFGLFHNPNELLPHLITFIDNINKITS